MSRTLKDLRLENGLTQSKLALLMNVHRNLIGRWENGKAELDADCIKRLALIFKLSDDEIQTVLKQSKIRRSDGTPNVIAFRCSDSLYEKIKANADQANLKIGTYVARTYEGGNVTVIGGLEEFNRELRQIGKNLNQLTLLANSGAIRAPDLKNLHSTLNSIYIKINCMFDQMN